MTTLLSGIVATAPAWPQNDATQQNAPGSGGVSKQGTQGHIAGVGSCARPRNGPSASSARHSNSACARTRRAGGATALATAARAWERRARHSFARLLDAFAERPEKRSEPSPVEVDRRRGISPLEAVEIENDVDLRRRPEALRRKHAGHRRRQSFAAERQRHVERRAHGIGRPLVEGAFPSTLPIPRDPFRLRAKRAHNRLRIAFPYCTRPSPLRKGCSPGKDRG